MASKIIPGAPSPSSASKSKKKSKKSSSTPSASAAPPSGATPIVDAASAALIEQSPAGHTEVAFELKVSRKDLSDKAEKHTAIAAVEAVEGHSTPTASSATSAAPAPAPTAARPTGKPERSAIQTLIVKRSTVVRKKIQRIQAYRDLDRSKLNPEQVRNLDAKPSFEAVHHELQELGKSIEAIERKDKEAAAAHAAEAKNEVEQSAKSRIVLLLQFLHLFNLYFLNQARDPSFAPKAEMPAALQNATGQQVAALGKIFDQLANGPLEGGHGDAFEVLASIDSGSEDEVLPDVTYATIRSMILQLTALPAKPEQGAAGSGADQSPGMTTPGAAAAPLMMFMQADEVAETGAKKDTVDDVARDASVVAQLDQSEEPEGGAPEPAVAVETPAMAGEQGGKGVILGSEEPTDAAADGTAAAAVDEPVNTTEVAPTTKSPEHEVKEAVGVAAKGLTIASGFNWADDADLSEALVFPSTTSSSATQFNTPMGSSTPVPAEGSSSDAATPPAPALASSSSPSAPVANRERKPRNGQTGGRGGGNAGQRNGHGSTQRFPAPKPQPIVDEDGFILQESKRSRMLANQQQRRPEGPRGRGGGRGGGVGGRGGRGGTPGSGTGNGSTRQSNNADGARSKAPRRGRAAAPDGANANTA